MGNIIYTNQMKFTTTIFALASQASAMTNFQLSVDEQ